MSKLLSGSTLRKGGSGEFISLNNTQPQLPATDTTTTGYTLVTDSLLRTTYRSSLGNLEFNQGTVYNNIANGNISFIGTGTGNVSVTGTTISTGSNSGAFVVNGAVGIVGTLNTRDDIKVHGLTIGQGYLGLNNIAIQGTASPQINEFNNGQSTIAVGYNTLAGVSTSYKSLAIGNYALSSGTNISNSIAIGDSALKMSGTRDAITLASITNISASNPAVVTAPNHGITTGTQVILSGVIGMIQLNTQVAYVKVLTTNMVALYSDNILTKPIDSSTYTPYASGGIISRVYLRNNNIAIGNNAGASLIDGSQNFFFGDNIAKNLTTGSNNFFIGHEVGNNLITGSSNIAIGGDNLVDGKNNQVNIGSIFYYDGGGYLELITDTATGLGSESTSTTSGAFTVNGGAGISGSLNVGKLLNVTSSTVISGSLTVYNALTVIGPKDITLNPQAASIYLQPALGGTIYIEPSALGIMDNVTIGSTIAADGTFLKLKAQTLHLYSTATSVSTSTGALIVDGGVGIAGDLHVGGSFFAGGTAVLTTSSMGNQVLSGQDILITQQANGTLIISDTATLQSVTDRGAITSRPLTLTSVTSATSTSTGALTVAGGVGIGGDVWVTGRVNSESLKIADTILDSTAVTTSTLSATVIDSYSITQFRSSKYIVQISAGIGANAQFQVIEVLLLVNNIGTVFATEYGTITSNGELGEFTADVLPDNIVRLYFTPYTLTSMNIKVLRTGMAL